MVTVGCPSWVSVWLGLDSSLGASVSSRPGLATPPPPLVQRRRGVLTQEVGHWPSSAAPFPAGPRDAQHRPYTGGAGLPNPGQPRPREGASCDAESQVGSGDVSGGAALAPAFLDS